MPEFIDSLPENFTFEFDLLCDNPVQIWGLIYQHCIDCLTAAILKAGNRGKQPFYFYHISRGGWQWQFCNMNEEKMVSAKPPTQHQQNNFADKTKPVHVAVWRQKERIRVYFNEEKAWDLPKAMSPMQNYNSYCSGGCRDLVECQLFYE